jgi:ProP effector
MAGTARIERRSGMNKQQRLTAALELIGVLAERFPAAFAIKPSYRRPLKLGIHVDILAQLSDMIAPRDLSNALRSYTSNRCYLHSCLTAGTPRIDLNGEVAGQVTESEAAHAAERLNLQKARQQEKAEPPTVAPPAPRRLGFGDLRQAAAARKVASG